jgi:DNA repair exonuclease SbcCD ATPase subunit
VLDLSLDSTGQENVVRLLRWLLQDVHSIMVISHREEISKDFDFNIQVHRNKEGISQIE